MQIMPAPTYSNNTNDYASAGNLSSDAKSGIVMALESEVVYLSHVAEEAERIASNIAGNSPPRDMPGQKAGSAPQPVLSISQRIAGAVGQISVLRERIGDAMSRIDQAF